MVSVNLFSETPGEIENFLSSFYNTSLGLIENLSWKQTYQNPIELAEIIGTYADNVEDFTIDMWICLDSGIYINVTDKNANDIIKYLYERYPY